MCVSIYLFLDHISISGINLSVFDIISCIDRSRYESILHITYISYTICDGHIQVYIKILFVYEVCQEKVQPLLIQQKQFAQHRCNLAAKKDGPECTCVNNDEFTVLVSGCGRHH